MYSIIYWRNAKQLFSLTKKDGTLFTTNTLYEADGLANLFENDSYKLPESIDLSNVTIDDEIEARVISLDSVHH